MVHFKVVQPDLAERDPVSAPAPLRLTVAGPAPVRLFTSPCLRPGEAELEALRQVAAVPGVVQVVGLPELHLKPRLEAPSSLAVATSNQLVLGFSSPSPNCGISLARTSISVEDALPERLDALFADLARRVPLQGNSQALTNAEMTEVLVSGAAAVVRTAGLDPQVLDYMDEGGNALAGFPPAELEAAVLAAVPASLRRAARGQFGQVGRGNHFIELQAVEKILDPSVAQAWGLVPGQLVVMTHADSGYLGAFTGRLYAHRRKNTWRGRFHELRLKLPFQVENGAFARLFQRLKYHVVPQRFTPIPVASPEAAQTLLALGAAANFAYANRLAILAALGAALETAWPGAAAPQLLWDASHNSIRAEQIGGQNLWVHRHNAARALPPDRLPASSPFVGAGQPVLLPGTERTRSYLAVAGAGASQSLYSVDHGMGQAAARLALPQPGDEGTRVYTYGGYLGSRPYLSDDGADALLEVLQSADIARPVASLRPLAVLKGNG